MSITIVALNPTDPGNFTVPHGVAGGPLFLPPIVMNSAGLIYYQTPVAYDATNLYLVASGGGITGFAEITTGGGIVSGNQFRYDGNVRDVIGDSLTGVSIAVLNQPADTSTSPGSPLAVIYSGPNSTDVNVTGASWLAGIATLVLTSVPSDLIVGSYIEPQSISPSGYNGIVQVTAIDGLNVSYALATNPGTYASGGTVRTSALPNPFLSDNLGNFFFYADPALYTVQIYGGTLTNPLDLPDQAITSGGAGVTSVGMTGDGVVFQDAVPGSPITDAGVLAPALAENSGNKFLASPADGTSGPWQARAIVAADISGLTGSGTVTSVSANNCAPLFTSAVTNPTSTPAIGFTVSNAAQNTALMGPTSGTGAPTYRQITPPDTTFPPLPTVGVCFLGPTSGNNAAAAPSWRAPFNCTVTNVRGYMVGGNNCTINAQNDGANLIANKFITTAGAWQDGGAITGATCNTGNTITPVLVTQAGNTASVTIQIDFTRP